MSVPFSTLIVEVYCVVDDFLVAHPGIRPRSPRGRKAKMTDAEVMTLALVGQRIGNSERHLLEVIRNLDATAFPGLLGPRQFNQRVRDLQPVIAALMQDTSDRIDRRTTPYEIVDPVSVPVVQPCREAVSPMLAPLVSGGYGGSSRKYFVGCQLTPAVTERGAITGFTLGSARTEGRWYFDAIVQWRADPASDQWPPETVRPRRPPTGPDKPILGRTTVGPPAMSGRYLLDNGFTGPWWHTHWHDLGANAVLDGGKRASADQRRAHRRRRHKIEIVHSVLKGALHLAFPNGRTPDGILARITAKCCMLNIGILINQRLQRDPLAIASLIRI